MTDITIRKGHNIRIAGVPKNEIQKGFSPNSVAIHPTDFKGVKPKLIIKEGEEVKIGSPLFFDKMNPDILRKIIKKLLTEYENIDNYEKHNYLNTALNNV